jgi:hypothetical protein
VNISEVFCRWDSLQRLIFFVLHLKASQKLFPSKGRKLISIGVPNAQVVWQQPIVQTFRVPLHELKMASANSHLSSSQKL